jgi:hypothetical protein
LRGIFFNGGPSFRGGCPHFCKSVGNAVTHTYAKSWVTLQRRSIKLFARCRNRSNFG